MDYENIMKIAEALNAKKKSEERKLKSILKKPGSTKKRMKKEGFKMGLSGNSRIREILKIKDIASTLLSTQKHGDLAAKISQLNNLSTEMEKQWQNTQDLGLSPSQPLEDRKILYFTPFIKDFKSQPEHHLTTICHKKLASLIQSLLLPSPTSHSYTLKPPLSSLLHTPTATRDELISTLTHLLTTKSTYIPESNSYVVEGELRGVLGVGCVKPSEIFGLVERFLE
ncbi:unnamed protein product [Moneuplotes crassus]|uniref:Uncharacterized protein n=1 Tax=Euplotes crassus TaxID=5936 RepID=A0AAD1U2P1_EUPCR|nr:unnamed protein product [Moneuplotes crassus]